MKLTKKILAVVLSVLFVVGVFAGCSANNADDKGEKTKSSATSRHEGWIYFPSR